MTNSIDSHIDSTMSESDRPEIIILENIGEQGNVDTEVILDERVVMMKMRSMQKLLKMKLRMIVQKISVILIPLLIYLLH